jgi:3-dehydroquinate synthase
MQKKSYSFSSSCTVHYYFDADFSFLEKLSEKQCTVIITDENLFERHKKKFKGWQVISIPSGEQHKNQNTVNNIIDQLIELGADRNTTLVGVGGGVITDITGFVAGIYMRGLKFGFVPTSILAMVDASIGGKNGIDVGLYKNMVGIIRQPSFLLYDYSFLKTLPKAEWINGFAEVIKHAAIHDAAMFKSLEASSLSAFQKDGALVSKLIIRNALLKTKVVIEDEFEMDGRKLLNFGHTIGHAIENLYRIPHGHAVSIGMGVACKISKQLNGFKEAGRVETLLKKYGLPPNFAFDKEQTLKILKSDKKKQKETISYVILHKIGKAGLVKLPVVQLESMINELQ